MKKEMEYEVIEHYGTISEDANGYTKEVTLMSWNGGDPKIDIRNWRPGMKAPLKGITLNYEDAANLIEILQGIKL